MASVVDICNLALAHLGDEANISSIDPPDQSVQAMYCAQFYPLALNEVVAEHAWGFTTPTVVLAETTNPNDLWLYAYALPSDFISALGVYDAESVDELYGSLGSAQQPYSVEHDDGENILLTNQYQAMLKYTRYVSNAGHFPPLFVAALAWKLAEFLAGPILKGDVGASAATKAMQAYGVALQKAMESDCKNRKPSARYVPAGIAARS
jgi:hypothetical protein